MFWHWLLIAKRTGMSQQEMCKMKWKSVEIVDVGRISKSKAIEENEQILEEIKEEGKENEIYVEPPDLNINFKFNPNDPDIRSSDIPFHSG